MKTNREVRHEAREILKTRWFWRLVTVGLVLNVISQLAGRAVSASFKELNVQTWNDFLLTKAQSMSSGLDYTVPSINAAWQMTGASAFQLFIIYIFGAILAFGFAGALLKASRDDSESWFKGSFGGFRRPLEVAWLMALMNIKVFLWSLLFVFPGFIAMYRYRQAWFVKSEHPEWSAGECIAESSRMMVGYKGQAFGLDFSFIGWFLLLAVTGGASFIVGSLAEGSVILSFVSFAFSLVTMYLLLFVLCYVFVSRAVFYRHLACAHARDMV